jgi:hypothetical protein
MSHSLAHHQPQRKAIFNSKHLSPHASPCSCSTPLPAARPTAPTHANDGNRETTRRAGGRGGKLGAVQQQWAHWQQQQQQLLLKLLLLRGRLGLPIQGTAPAFLRRARAWRLW